LNEDDPYPNSNMSEKINIDGCNPNVNNVLVRNGTTMMDQVDTLIAEINSQYNGNNYDFLHRKFIMELERKVTDWRRNRLVTNRQRDAISSCARSASIPYFNQPT
ncbi:MAG: hypothetical protein PHW92_14450, partial [Lutibacter sp.]|nr:hypothetical protein [Lutibacter sp.]